MTKCAKVGCPRSILYCYECDNMKNIEGGKLECDWNDKNTKNT
jgi:hypothetical protein